MYGRLLYGACVVLVTCVRNMDVHVHEKNPWDAVTEVPPTATARLLWCHPGYCVYSTLRYK